MTQELPQGWTAARLEELTENPRQDIVDGPFGSNLKASEYVDDGIPIVRLQNIDRNRFLDKNIRFVTRQKADDLARHSFRTGDIIITKLGDPVGKACIVPGDIPDGIIVADVVRARIDQRMAMTGIVAYAINSPAVVSQLNLEVKGSTRPRVNLGHIRSMEIPLPPLAEQQRIVAKLEVLLDKVDACRERLEKIPVILRRFRQSVLAAACSGRLTADWREENPETTIDVVKDRNRDLFQNKRVGIPDTWKWAKFESILASIRGGSTVPPQKDPTDFPILRSSSVRQGSIDFSDIRFVNTEDSKNLDNFVTDGDLLFTRLSGSIEYVANCALARHLSGRRIQYPDRLFCAKVKDQRMAAYVELCFGNPVLRAELTEHAKSSAGHQRVSISDITGQVIPLPPIPEQHEIVRRVEALFSLADQTETRYAKAKCCF